MYSAELKLVVKKKYSKAIFQRKTQSQLFNTRLIAGCYSVYFGKIYPLLGIAQFMCFFETLILSSVQVFGMFFISRETHQIRP
jgi:hypothetical protein